MKKNTGNNVQTSNNKKAPEQSAKDYYEILGVAKDASLDDIKRAFRKIARENHPDRGGNEERFKEASEAYKTLSDEKKRAEYDRYDSTKHEVSVVCKKTVTRTEPVTHGVNEKADTKKVPETASPSNTAEASVEDNNAENKLTFWKWVGGTYLSLLLISLGMSVAFIGADWNWGLALFLSLVLYTIASSKKLGPTEQGVRIFYGRPIDQIASGYVFVPSGLVELVIFPCSIIQNEFPDNPEKIYRGKDGDHGVIPPGLKPPIRIPFGLPGAQGDSVLDRDPLNQRLIEEVVPIVRWKITDCIAFLTTIETLGDAASQMEDLCVATLSEEFGKLTPAQVVANYQPHNDRLTEELQEAVNTWGITIESAKVKVINFSHDLNKAIQTIAEKTARGKALTIAAEGFKRAKILRGEGSGLAEKAVLEGRTAGLKNMMTELAIDGSVVLAAETARGITNNPGQKTIIAGSGGFKDLATVGTILGETLTNRKEAENVV